jgi:tetratricopeptide (TPR) repeat protein
MAIRIQSLAGTALVLAACVHEPPPSRPDLINRAEGQLAAGVAMHEQGRYDHALRNFQQALALFGSFDHADGMARAHLDISETCLESGDSACASAHLGRTRALVSSVQGTDLPRQLDIVEASVAIEEGNFPRATQILDPLTARFTADKANVRPDMLELAALASRTRVAHLTEQEASLWTDRYARALSSLNPVPPLHRARLLRFEAALAYPQSARRGNELYGEALSIYRSLAYRKGVGSTLNEWGDWLQRAGEWQMAEATYMRALRTGSVMHDRSGSLRALSGLDATYVAQKKTANVEKVQVWILEMHKREFNHWREIEAFAAN